ncbi:phosphoribosylformylglycinamidine synthase subunit PurL [Mahella australiensis]|uniref:Phosphoribosylformylglycinamidine synthase subunit PurL n=1 Tax=Mahella australiensis (strain DSM 15567 / CIP 107919 / 50-1 BON) TaxID=697281 RepID=F3ZZJ0_MAHA5|nr:phosphoribosylformylglycinamidine synthase subunit PurL [Mahella australiensis]AEE96816.1 phosphoribosylformylglycinamidine synthase subunit II [Mahella australiensis 50-1 BON]
MPSKQRWDEVGLTENEYRMIIDILGREPNDLELNLYGVMWSEHCGYKHSRAMLKMFPTSGPRILQGPGENAGIVDIGDGLAVCMKVESHNHPSALEPYQGAATGMGGIIRDIFTMGSRPVALLDSLKFGPLDNPRSRYLMDGVVSGIAGYGNCIGIPTVAGEVGFDPCYTGNPLVNAMCVGLIRHDEIQRGAAAGVGNSVMIVGHTTGRDGMGGASFASVEITAESEERRSAVQVGDPFMEKLLLEACLELFKTGCVVGIQDMGAAGIISSTCETAARAGTGIELDVALVPKRETGMTPTQVMISESQERMLVIVEKGREQEVYDIFDKWGLHAVVIGHVTDDGMLRVLDNGIKVGEVPAKSLAEAPVYHPDYAKPDYIDELAAFNPLTLTLPDDMNDVLLKLLASPDICSKRWVYRQYDYMVRTDTAVPPGSGDAAVVRIKGTSKAIALTIDSNGRYSYLDPYKGGMIAVAEAARNIVCTGALPIAITDCLNFGTPEKPDIYWQFRESIVGMAEACRALDTPVISGNVSFYNETDRGAIYPTPTVGMAGVMEDVKHITTQAFKKDGDAIVLLGETKEELGASQFLNIIYGMQKGKVPDINLEKESSVQKAALKAIQEGIISSAHDCSDGGLAIALAESCISGRKGAYVNLKFDIRTDALLFGESQSRILISLKPEYLDKLFVICESFGVPCQVIGTVCGDRLNVDVNGNKVVQLPIEEMKDKWEGTIPAYMNGR